MDASNEEYVLSSKIYHDDAQQPADAARPPADAKQPPEGLGNCGVGNGINAHKFTCKLQ